MTRKMKESGIEWIGEIPKNWMVNRLKVALKKEKDIIDNYTDEPVLSLTINGVIQRDLINIKGKMPASFDGYQKVDKNSMIACLFDIDVTPRCIGIAYEEGVTSPAYTQFKVNKIYDYEYMFYYLLFMDNDKILVPISKSLRNTITSDDFLNLSFCSPDLEKQRKIVNILKKSILDIDNIISNTKQTIGELKKYKQSLITEVVTKGLDKNVEMKDSGIEWIGEIPKDWVVIKLKYLMSESTAKSYDGSEIPLSMSQVHGLVPTTELGSIPNPSESNIGKKKVFKEEIVFNKLKAHLGVFSVSKYDGIVSPDYAVYQVNDRVINKYLEYVFKSTNAISEFIKNSRGIAAGLTRLYTEDLFNIFVPVPSIEIQQQIIHELNDKINNIDNLIVTKNRLINEYDLYKKSLIYEYVTGKKEVGEEVE